MALKVLTLFDELEPLRFKHRDEWVINTEVVQVSRSWWSSWYLTNSTKGYARGK